MSLPCKVFLGGIALTAHVTECPLVEYMGSDANYCLQLRSAQAFAGSVCDEQSTMVLTLWLVTQI